jgi:2'-5' RNA ligase
VRLFVALEIPSSVRDHLAEFTEEMSALSEQCRQKRVRWVRPQNLHVTLKFIGEVADAKLDGIRAALEAVRLDAPINVEIRGIGFFPNEEQTTVLWTGLAASSALSSLAAAIDSTLATLEIQRETREFLPHLTLARFAPPGIQKRLLAAIKQHGEHEFGSFEAREFQLIESKLKPSGAEYTSLATLPFALEA